MERSSKELEKENLNTNTIDGNDQARKLSVSQDESILEFRNYERITKNGEDFLQRVSFSILKGKITAVLALNGKSKAALLESIAGHCEPSDTTYGEVYVQNKAGILAPRDVIEWFSSVSYVQASEVDYEAASVYEVFCLIARCFGKSAKDVDEYIDLLQMSKVKNMQFKKLSDGEEQQVMVIVGLLSEKKFNIWDEPLTGLDSEIAKIVLSTIKKMNSTNIIAVEELSEDLMKYFDHIIFMYKSTVVYSGPASEIKNYFTEKGIEFPKEMFYINYLMQLCTENSQDRIDTKNNEIFKEIVDSILCSSYGAIGHENISFIPAQLKVSFTRVLGLFTQESYFGMGFKGMSVIVYFFASLLLLGLCVIGVLSLRKKKYLEMASTMGKTRGKLIFSYIYRLNLIKEKNLLELEKDLLNQEMISTLLKHLANMAWSIRLQNIFSLVSILFFLLFAVQPERFLKESFYELCKRNIDGGQITIGDFVAFKVLGSFLEGTVFIWILQLVIYWTAYFSFESTAKKYITMSHMVAMGLLFLSSLLTGAYSLLANFLYYLQHKSKLCVGLTLVYLIFVEYFSVIFYCIQKTQSPYDFRYIEELMICMSKNGIEYKLKENTFNYAVIIKPIKWLRLYVPLNSFPHLFQKVALYSNQLKVGPGEASNIDDDVITRFVSKICDALPIKYFDRPLNEYAAEQFQNMVTDIYGELRAHEILSADDWLTNISLLDIIWSAVRFWIIPSLVLLAITYNVYVNLRPNLRN